MAEQECGCKVGQTLTKNNAVIYCPMHQAAPAMLEALHESENVYAVARSYLGGNDRALRYLANAQGLIRAAVINAEPEEAEPALTA